MDGFIERWWPLRRVRVGRNIRGSDSIGVYRVVAEEGEFILKIARASSASTMAAGLEIFDFLESRNYPHAPKLVRCRDGATFQGWEDGFAYLYESVPGERPEPTPESCAKLGQAVARLHRLEGHSHRGRWTTEEVIGHIIHDRAPLLPYREGFLKIAHQLRHLDDLPHCLVHGDVAFINCILAPSGQIVLIDWGGWYGPRVLDTAKVLLQFLDGGFCFDEPGARAFYRAYFSNQAITDEEMACYFDAAILMMMNYVLYGQPRESWERILWAYEHRDWLLKLVESCR